MTQKRTDIAPISLTPAETQACKGLYLQALVNCGGLVSEAVASAGLDPTQLYKWRERDEEFRQLEEFARMAVDDNLRRKIDELVQEGNVQIISAAMKRLPEYQPKSVKQVDVSGTVTHEHVKKMAEDERQELILEAANLIEDVEVE